ncbi:TRAP transporter small permease [Pseudoxanthomonas gei]|uniref:TRAP transporter small permease protein n=1 Tax=Pseudoxanthomonas gei TaxID=1383030 RepID=A0ABX0AAC5_9GAMM|nr:TRAP transporter small permease [Pseudoxanthomonas gei]NDK38487.1 TRAP transporter small permease [Pseudoxanthomonas gei]
MLETTSESAPSRGVVARAVDLLSDLAIGIAAAALLGLVVVQGWQVIARYVLNDSPSWTEPVTLLLLSTAMSMGAAAGVHSKRHFGFYLLANSVGANAQRVLQAIPPLVIVAIGATIAWWGWILLVDGFDIPTAGANLPQSINYLPLSIGGGLMVVFALLQLVEALHAPVPAGAP